MVKKKKLTSWKQNVNDCQKVPTTTNTLNILFEFVSINGKFHVILYQDQPKIVVTQLSIQITRTLDLFVWLLITTLDSVNKLKQTPKMKPT